METTTAVRHASGGPGHAPPAQNLAKAFQMTVERLGDRPALRWGEGETMSWNELRAQAAAVAGGLAKLGVGNGDTVAIMLNNRAEFFPIDMGVSTLGGVPFSIYQTASPEQIAYVVGDAGAKVAIVEKMFLEVFDKARPDLPELEHVIVLDGEGGTMSYEQLLETDPDFDDVASADTVQLDDPLTLIYTSGTTGPPKGVELTHRNLLTLVAGVDDLIALPEEGAKVISWLPAAHIAERGAHYYLPMTKGVQVSICPDPRTIIDFLPTVRPTWFFAVPRVWEKLKGGLEAMMAALPEEQREPALQGLQAAIAKVRAEQAGEDVPEEIEQAAAAAEKAMFAGLRTSPRPRRGDRRQRRRRADARSRCSSSSTRSGSRSASSGGCRRPAGRPRSTLRTTSSSARSARRFPASRSASPRTARSRSRAICSCAATATSPTRPPRSSTRTAG